MPGIRIACEQAITQLKKELAISHGTATATFKYGAYVTDPLKLVRMLNVLGKRLVIGGDRGGGSTKLGVSYFDKNNKLHFICLVVADVKDNYKGLKKLGRAGLTPFVGESAAYSDIWSVLQHLVSLDPHRTMINGDW